MPTQNGTLAVAWGIGTTMTGTGVGTFSAQGSTFTPSGENVITKNGNGEDVNSTWFNQTQTHELSITPSGTTLALAIATNIVPTPGTILQVGDANDTDLGSASSWECISASKTRTNTGAVQITVSCRRWMEDNGTSVRAVATLISS